MKIGVVYGGEVDGRVCSTRDAFMAGILAQGDRAFYIHHGVYHAQDFAEQLDAVVIWGTTSRKFLDTTQYRDAVRLGHDHVICLERGFVNREQYYAAGWNDVAGKADFCNKNSPDDRWKALGIPLQPFNTDGAYTLFLKQVPWDTAVQDCTNYEQWCEDIIFYAGESWTNDVVVREHPDVAKTIQPPLLEQLKGARDVFAWSSTGLVEAMIAGRHSTSFSNKAMVRGGSFTQREGRIEWARDIAYAQWTHDEMREGKAWAHLKQGRFG